MWWVPKMTHVTNEENRAGQGHRCFQSGKALHGVAAVLCGDLPLMVCKPHGRSSAQMDVDRFHLCLSAYLHTQSSDAFWSTTPFNVFQLYRSETGLLQSRAIQEQTSGNPLFQMLTNFRFLLPQTCSSKFVYSRHSRSHHNFNMLLQQLVKYLASLHSGQWFSVFCAVI